MEHMINIQISCPINIHNEIEEYCINNGLTLSKYFISLHQSSLDRKKINKEIEEVKKQVDEEIEEVQKPKGKKK
jgi:hypothetical protein